MPMLKHAIAALCLSAALWDVPARAVMVLGDQGRNTAAPTGPLAGSGWELQGKFGDYSGTPISPNWFVTAAHVGYASGTIVLADGSHALTGANFAVPGTDLIMRQVATPFSAFAPIFNPVLDGDLTTADTLVVFGRGTDRGSVIPGKGWNWGASDHALAWGTNAYAGTVTISAEDAANGVGFAAGTSFIAASFDNNGNPNEATVSNGDSGGGVFVQRGGQWKLVGINFGVDLFATSASGGDLAAAIYDARGLYAPAGNGQYAYVDPAAEPSAVPQYWYASYVPSTLGQIMASPIPEPTGLAALGIVATLLTRRGRQVGGR